MSPPRRRAPGFRRAGAIAATGLGLSAARGRELGLLAAWHDVAGAAVARRARAVRVSRGVLEIAVAEPRWAEALAPLVPRLAARLAARHPDLGVKRLRLLRPGDTRSTSAVELPAPDVTEDAPGPFALAPLPAAEGSPAEPPTERLRRAAARLLERRRGR